MSVTREGEAVERTRLRIQKRHCLNKAKNAVFNVNEILGLAKEQVWCVHNYWPALDEAYNRE